MAGVVIESILIFLDYSSKDPCLTPQYLMILVDSTFSVTLNVSLDVFLKEEKWVSHKNFCLMSEAGVGNIPFQAVGIPHNTWE